MAGTSLRGAITNLLNPSSQAEKILGKLGVTVDGHGRRYAPARQHRAAVRAVRVVGWRCDGDLRAARRSWHASARIQLGAKVSRTTPRSLENAEGAAADMAETQQKGLVGSMTRLTSAVDTLMIRFGERLEPMVGTLVDQVCGLRHLADGL